MIFYNFFVVSNAFPQHNFIDGIRPQFKALRYEEDWSVKKDNPKFQLTDPFDSIKYIPTREGCLYLAVVLDLYNRKVVDWSMDRFMTRQLVINALTMAIQNNRPKSNLLHHSDQRFSGVIRQTRDPMQYEPKRQLFG